MIVFIFKSYKQYFTLYVSCSSTLHLSSQPYPVRQDFGKTRLNAQKLVVFSVLRRVFGHGHVNTDNFVFQWVKTGKYFLAIIFGFKNMRNTYVNSV